MILVKREREKEREKERNLTASFDKLWSGRG